MHERDDHRTIVGGDRAGPAQVGSLAPAPVVPPAPARSTVAPAGGISTRTPARARGRRPALDLDRHPAPATRHAPAPAAPAPGVRRHHQGEPREGSTSTRRGRSDPTVPAGSPSRVRTPSRTRRAAAPARGVGQSRETVGAGLGPSTVGRGPGRGLLRRAVLRHWSAPAAVLRS